MNIRPVMRSCGSFRHPLPALRLGDGGIAAGLIFLSFLVGRRARRRRADGAPAASCFPLHAAFIPVWSDELKEWTSWT